jgi:hypothetical protein
MERIEMENQNKTPLENELEYYKTLVKKQRLASKNWKLAHPEKQKEHMKVYYEKHIKNNPDKRFKQLEANKRYYNKRKALKLDVNIKVE